MGRPVFWRALPHQHDGSDRRTRGGAGADVPGRARGLPAPPRGQERRARRPAVHPPDGRAPATPPSADRARVAGLRRQGVEPPGGGGGRAGARPRRGLYGVHRRDARPVAVPGAAGAEAHSGEAACRGDGTGDEHDQGGAKRTYESTRSEPAALARRRAEGNDPAHGGEAGRAKGRRNAAHAAANAAWDAEHGSERDPEAFQREILPNLQRVPLSKMAQTTGLSLRYCALVRRGEETPHPRHWEALAALGETREP